MKRLYILMLVSTLTLASCATAPKMNRLSVGMTKSQVLSVMGEPTSTAATDGVEFLRYRLSPTSDHAFNVITEEYFVRLVNGTVDCYGKMGDFDSAQKSTLNVNIKER